MFRAWFSLLLGASVFVLFMAACRQESEQVTIEEEYVQRDSLVCFSLMGDSLKHLPELRSVYDYKDSMLQVARQAYIEDSRSLDNIIWYGRRLAYLTDYREAMSVYTRGLHLHPKSPEIYRHRGHRYISMRRFEEAVNDLALAAEYARGRDLQIEPDGIPNAINRPLSNLQFNIWYHLGLAHYLQGDYEQAATAYDSCLKYSVNPDLLTATTDWYYLTLMRLGDPERALALLEPIGTEMEVIENDAYYQRLLMYKGVIAPEAVLDVDSLKQYAPVEIATRGYGVASHLIHKGNTSEGKQLLRDILETGMWPAFGYIAAEADVARGM